MANKACPVCGLEQDERNANCAECNASFDDSPAGATSAGNGDDNGDDNGGEENTETNATTTTKKKAKKKTAKKKTG